MTSPQFRWLTGVAALALCVTGCGLGLTTPTTGGSSSQCSWLSPSAPPVPSGAVQSDTVVMIDASASFWPKAGTSVQLPDDLAHLVTNALVTNFDSRGTRLISLGVFDGSSTTISWELGDAALPVPAGDDQEVGAEMANAESCLQHFVTTAESAAPRTAGTDELAALAAAGGRLRGASPSDDHVMVFTDGLSNTGCLDLSKTIQQGQTATAVLAGCPEHAGLAALKGVHLSLSGVGLQAGAPPLTTAEESLVQNYWQALCTALGVASTDSCVTAPQADATRTSAISRLADPAITFPSVRPGVRKLDLPADLLFAFDSATLSPAGRSYLDVFLDQLKGQGRTIKEVIGHTDEVGGAEYNMGLSRRRADAVRSYLASQGFTGVLATGVGESDPACSPEHTSAGVAIPACRAKDRRVQILLGG